MQQATEWWEEYYRGIGIDVHLASKDSQDTAQEVEFIERSLAPPPHGQLLDVPCGAGRHAINLAQRGYRITGVDITQPLLDVAASNAAYAGVCVEWEHRDMRDLPWHHRFDGAFCFWGSFGYFDDAGNREFLCAVARVLKPGARFVLDTHVSETLLPSLVDERTWSWVGPTRVLAERSFDPLEARTTTRWTLMQNGSTQERITSIRLYSYRELLHLLSECGFECTSMYGSLDGVPFVFGSQRLYLVAERRHSNTLHPLRT